MILFWWVLLQHPTLNEKGLLSRYHLQNVWEKCSVILNKLLQEVKMCLVLSYMIVYMTLCQRSECKVRFWYCFVSISQGHVILSRLNLHFCCCWPVARVSPSKPRGRDPAERPDDRQNVCDHREVRPHHQAFFFSFCKKEEISHFFSFNFQSLLFQIEVRQKRFLHSHWSTLKFSIAGGLWKSCTERDLFFSFFLSCAHSTFGMQVSSFPSVERVSTLRNSARVLTMQGDACLFTVFSQISSLPSFSTFSSWCERGPAWQLWQCFVCSNTLSQSSNANWQAKLAYKRRQKSLFAAHVDRHRREAFLLFNGLSRDQRPLRHPPRPRRRRREQERKKEFSPIHSKRHRIKQKRVRSLLGLPVWKDAKRASILFFFCGVGGASEPRSAASSSPFSDQAASFLRLSSGLRYFLSSKRLLLPHLAHTHKKATKEWPSSPMITSFFPSMSNVWPPETTWPSFLQRTFWHLNCPLPGIANTG